MLADFALNKRREPPQKDMSRFNQQVGIFSARGMPIDLGADHPALSGSADFKWLL